MFIQVNGRPLNVYSVLYYYTREITSDDITSYGLYYRLTDGRVLEELFESAEARDLKVEELGTATLGGLVQENTYNDFPERGSEEILYLAKDTGQMWFWDVVLEQYEKIGVSRKGGVYQYASDLPNTIGSTVEIAKSDLDVIIEASVPYMDGSEVTAHNAIRGIIVSSTETHVTVRTIADMVIDSFVQVENEESLPAKGELNVLYYLKSNKQLRTYNGTSYQAADGPTINGHIIITVPYDKRDKAGISEIFQNEVNPYINGIDDLLKVIIIYEYSKALAPILLTAQQDYNTFGTSHPFYLVRFMGYAEASAISFQDGYRHFSPKTVYIVSASMYIDEPNTVRISTISVGEEKMHFLDAVNSGNDLYIPTADNHPANKKYVDILRNDVDTFRNEVHTTYAIFNGDEDEYEALTQEQKNAYFLAVVNPLVTTENINLDTVEQIIVDETPTETVIDMTDEEVDESLNTIIDGGTDNV